MKMVILASDHAGFKLKEIIKKFLIKKRNKVLDLGTKNTKSVDYPDYAHLLSKKMKKSTNKLGILICGSGTGMAMTANKHRNIRAALCYNIRTTKLSRKHNNANVMTLGARLINKNIALKCVNTFLNTDFDFGRHLKRIKKI
ncbi:MAG: ribose 5-phosphate isomerase B [Candidatus Pelagibacterales bacterium]|nr:MAG: ribose 5-phosphate isomerase B [Pelagibacterales bacterium]